jgi:Domain of unknown function (DUF5060)
MSRKSIVPASRSPRGPHRDRELAPPSGARNAVTVDAFYDGGNTWRARVYVGETGKWAWASTCETDRRRNGQSGDFVAEGSTLRGCSASTRPIPRRG